MPSSVDDIVEDFVTGAMHWGDATLNSVSYVATNGAIVVTGEGHFTSLRHRRGARAPGGRYLTMTFALPDRLMRSSSLTNSPPELASLGAVVIVSDPSAYYRNRSD